MDIKQIIQWSIKRWWWFAISVGVCLTLAVVRFYTTSPRIEVRAALMLRSMSENGGGADEMMQMRGFTGNKTTSDEVKVLTSRDLVGRVVDELDLCHSYSRRIKGIWREQYPQHDLTASMDFTKPQPVTIYVKVRKPGSYVVKVKRYHRLAERYKVNDFSQPIHTVVGDLTLNLCDTISKGHYRATIFPRSPKVDQLIQQIKVSRLARESNVITLSSVTTTPLCMTATINTLLKFYNLESTTDKNILAVQTERFLSDRISVVEQELTNLEAEIESYKRSQQIANLSKTAENFQKMETSYKEQVAEIDASLIVVEYVLEQLQKPENEYSMIAGNLLGENEVMNALVQDYNDIVAHRNAVMLTATEQNKVVLKENEIISRKRQSVIGGMEQERQTLLLKRQSLLQLQNEYSARLAALPETERHYLEMSRAKETKEKQYIYLIEKREENAVMLSADAVPARIVESAQPSSIVTSPLLKNLILIAIFIGMLLPYLVYLFGQFRIKYL